MELAFFATLREITGRSKQPWNGDVETAGDLIRELCTARDRKTQNEQQPARLIHRKNGHENLGET